MPAPAEPAQLRLLFVCIENSCRSQLAQGFARAAGCQAYSAGSRPSGQVNPLAVSAMADLDLDISNQRSQSLDDLPPGPFDAAVTMGCGDSCPSIAAAHREDWAIPDPKAMDRAGFAAVRDRIGREVAALITRLTEEPGPS